MLISDPDFNFDKSKLAHIAHQIIHLAKFFHKENFMHRNFNPDIFFFCKRNLKLTLIDIHSLYPNKVTKQKCTVNIIYASPEYAGEGNYYDYKTDIFSIGVLLYSLTYGFSPYDCEDDLDLEEITEKIISHD